MMCGKREYLQLTWFSFIIIYLYHFPFNPPPPLSPSNTYFTFSTTIRSDEINNKSYDRQESE